MESGAVLHVAIHSAVETAVASDIRGAMRPLIAALPVLIVLAIVWHKSGPLYALTAVLLVMLSLVVGALIAVCWFDRE